MAARTNLTSCRLHSLTGLVSVRHAAQAPVLAAQPSAVTVLPTQPTASMGAGSSAQLQEAPMNVSPPCICRFGGFPRACQGYNVLGLHEAGACLGL